MYSQTPPRKALKGSVVIISSNGLTFDGIFYSSDRGSPQAIEEVHKRRGSQQAIEEVHRRSRKPTNNRGSQQTIEEANKRSNNLTLGRWSAEGSTTGARCKSGN